MEIVRTVPDARNAVRALRRNAQTLALVPTMGALHAGHLSLVDEGLQRADHVAATIFVNPRQFGAGEDLSRYPRQEAADIELLRRSGCKLLFAPSPDVVYPDGFATTVSTAGLGDVLEGAHRPGHFDGVTTVVAKLFSMIQPDIAIFGEKDWQQLAIIRRMTTDLDLPVEIIGAPIVRDTDGLALSSRNTYLDAVERQIASALPQTLETVRHRLLQGDDLSPVLADGTSALLAAGFATVDYLVLADPGTLQPLERLDRPARLLVAVRVGTTRLIDNFAVEASR